MKKYEGNMKKMKEKWSMWRNVKEIWRNHEEMWRKYEELWRKYEGNIKNYEGNFSKSQSLHYRRKSSKFFKSHSLYREGELGIFPSSRACSIEGKISEFFQVPEPIQKRIFLHEKHEGDNMKKYEGNIRYEKYEEIIWKIWKKYK